ncbi:MAG: D-alanyl-D-alanine carboxypeptidase [Acidobacteria bacterium]|nr:D-alanyl-D-alanine carboxypeptidase [Acidobacteriota bacterium]
MLDCGSQRAAVMPTFLTVFCLLLLAPAGENQGLVWHVEDAEGRVLSSRHADKPFNPASLVKLATSLWALERLGPEYRFSTRFTGVGEDLVVRGGGDPDFQPENAFLVASALNRAGIHRIDGRLLVDDLFWIGWEHGQGRNGQNPDRRAGQMATRLRRAFDPDLWNDSTRKAWKGLAQREGLDRSRPPRVVIAGGTGRAGSDSEMAMVDPAGLVPPATMLVVHRSRPLAGTLKRFNAWSNNDINRLEATLGGPVDLQNFLAARWQLEPGDSLRVESSSGLGKNRLTPRLAVRLLRDLEETLRRRHLDLSDVLPVAGCDAGTLKSFPALGRGGRRGSMVAKTGSLTTTDGGITLLAGTVATATGTRLFCVAAPQSGPRLAASRAREQRWLLDLISAAGGARGAPCGKPIPQAGGAVQLIEPLSPGAPGS